MNSKIQAAVWGAQKLIKEQINMGYVSCVGQSFGKYSLIYGFATENVNGYLSLLNLENSQKALSVLASGDQIFSLMTYNIRDFTTFDTNNLTEYYALGLKRAIILKYSYQGFLKFYQKILTTSNLEEISEMLKGLFPYMTNDHCLFWSKIIDYNYQSQKKYSSVLNLMQMLLLNPNLNINRCTYLLCEKNYNQAKANLIKANISFKNVNALNLKENFNSKYDLILLSNIADYFSKSWGYNWSYSKLKAYENNLLSLLEPKGIIALAYLFKKYRLSNQEFLNVLIEGSTTNLKDLTNEEIITFANISNQGFSRACKDALILIKQK